MNEEDNVKKEVSEDFSTSDQVLKDAVKSVYKRYGTNLSEFFNDAYRQEERERRERGRKGATEACTL